MNAQSCQDETSSSNVPGANTSGPLRTLEPVSKVVPLVSLADLAERRNDGAKANDQDFAAEAHVRQQAAEALIESHARTLWARASSGRNRPLRGPTLLAKKFMCSVDAVEACCPELLAQKASARAAQFLGVTYKCSEERLRPVADDDARQLAGQDT